MILTPIQLPCGQTLTNRLCKAAMTERLAESNQLVNDKHIRLYRLWAQSGFGLHLSGNIMIDKSHMESVGNIAALDDSVIPGLQKMTQEIISKGAQFWAQLNHSGRQTSYMINMRPKSASDVWLKRGGFYAKPRAMTEGDIHDVIHNFGKSAELCIKGGFTGIQIHAAHGYLISQFLSPLTNLRTDQWGGPIENRARLLLKVIEECRSKLGPNLPISVKLNSADFQKGGFDENESIEVIKMIEDKIDLLEISGGTYEKQAMMGEHQAQSTQLREAYFLDFADKVRQHSKIPLMVTGGFKKRSTIETALASGAIDMAGIARPFCTQPDAMHDFLMGEIEELQDFFTPAKSKVFTFSAEGGYYAKHIIDLGYGRPLNLDMSGNAAGQYLMKYEAQKAVIRRLKNLF